MSEKTTETAITATANTASQKKYVELCHSFTDMWADNPNEQKEIKFHFCKPSKADISRFQATVSKNSVNANRELLLALVRSDERQAFIESMDEYPGILLTFVEPVLRSIGFGSDLGK